MTTEKQPSKYLRKIMNKSKENRKKGLASPIFNTISDMKKWYDNQDDTTEKQETMEWEKAFDESFDWDDIRGYIFVNDFGKEIVREFMRGEIHSAVQKARIEVAEEIFKDIIQENYPSTDIDHKRMGKILNHIQAKYLSPTQEKLLCGCPKPDRFAMCINQEHCKEKVQNKINTRSIDTEEKDHGCDMHDRSIHGDIPDDAYCNHCILRINPRNPNRDSLK